MSDVAPQSVPSTAARLPWGLLAGFVALGLILLLPTPHGLPVAGHRMLAILVFAVIVWITEAVDYAVSSVIIVALIAVLLGTAPALDDPTKAFGRARGLGLGLGGFANSSLALVGAALVLAAAMTITRLDRRIALLTLSRTGTSTRAVLVGVIIVTFLLSLIVPSATARTACVVPIMLGVIAAFGVEKRSRFAAGIMIMVAQVTSIWNVGILTSAAQNPLTTGFMQKSLGKSVTWLQWFIAGAPWAIVMSIVAYFVIVWLMPPERDRIEGGAAAVKRDLAALGPMSRAEKTLLLVSLSLLFCWSTEQKLHTFDTTTTTIVGLSVLLLPIIGVMTWTEAQQRVPWGTLIVFGVGISLGTALLETKAAAWLADLVVKGMGLETFSAFGLFAVLSAFLIVIHIGFASATALTASLIPIMIAVLQKMPGNVNVLGMTMLLGFTVSFGFILPVNAPQNMVCFGTETFTARQFAKVGLVVTAVGYLMLLIFAATYWRFLGWV